MNAITIDAVRHDWTRAEVLGLFERPFLDLVFEAQAVHRRYHAANEVQLSQLLSIKTGGCPEDCGYCPQAQKFAGETGLKASKLMDVDAVLTAARAAREAGATRFCMGAAWTRPKDKDLEPIAAMIEGVRAIGMETCVTLGMLEQHQARRLADAGLDYYNHNIDTSPEYYKEIITTRQFDERLETLEHVRGAGINVCCGGIVGMGESREDRAGMIAALASLPEHPQSVPINRLVRVKGTALAETPEIEGLEFVRTVAVARLTMPKAMVRLSAGRETMSDELQALCFLAGASSIFRGEKLLTTKNPGENRDSALFKTLGLTAA